jgi:hypothetical protein
VWLNADIIRGPVAGSRDPIDADKFLKLCKTYFPQATLSVGWTVDVPKFYLGGGKYSLSHVKNMVDALRINEIQQPVTFPVFALFAPNSVQSLTWLLDNVQGSSITLWGGKKDAPYHNRKRLTQLRDHLGNSRVFVDLPYVL